MSAEDLYLEAEARYARAGVSDPTVTPWPALTLAEQVRYAMRLQKQLACTQRELARVADRRLRGES